MPSPGFARELATESERWVAEGLVTPEQAEALRARHPATPEETRGDSAASQILYGTAGILLGAAAIALVVVGLDTQTGFPLALLGLALLGGGVALRFALPERGLLGDALLVAGLVPLVTSAFPDENEMLGWLSPLAAIALLAWRRDGGFVAPLSVIAFTVGIAAAAFQTFDDAGALLWLGAQILLALGIGLAGRAGLVTANTLASALATIAIVPAILGYAFTADRAGSSEALELTIGAAMLGAMAIGLALKDRGMLLGAATALGVDAIVFAFDFGGVFTGTIVLVALAALLVFQAEALKRFFRPTPPA